MRPTIISGMRQLLSKLKAVLTFSLEQRIHRDVGELDEKSVVDGMLAKLSGEYRVLKEYYCLSRSIDYIIIGPTGIFVIGVMIHRGTVERMGDELLLNNRRPPQNFITRIRRQRDELHSLLQQKSGGDWPPQPVLCFIHAYIKTRGKISGVSLTPISELVGEITEQPVILDTHDIGRIANCLQP
jgi:Nuclease-related domain